MFPVRYELNLYVKLKKVYLLSGLVVRVTGYRSRGPVRFSALSDFLKSTGSGTGSTQPREYNYGAT
jgi:hypothetical protein